MKAIICVGISAAGKTTFAKEYAQKHKAIISNRDDLRFSLTGVKDWSEYKFDKKIESAITELQRQMLYEARRVGKDFILSDTNLDEGRRDIWVKEFENYSYEIEIKPFPITLEEAWKRDALRPNGVGQNVIYRQWKQWLKFIGRKTYTPNNNLPRAVLFDVDGTLMHMTDRKPYDWDKVDTDVPDPIVREMYWDFHSRGYKMIILSGRDSVCRDKTCQSLVDCSITPWDVLIMRAEGDMRKDTIVKEEIFWRDIAPYYNVQAVVDDRPCCVRLWNDIGIPKVIAVGDQNMEF